VVLVTAASNPESQFVESTFGLLSQAMARRKDQAARRRQLRHAARRAIAARGIDGLRIKDVAAEAGLSSQSVLYYYPELDGLVEEAIAHTLERFADRRAVDEDDPRAALVAMVGAGLPSGPDDEDLRVLYEAAGYFRDNPRLGEEIRALTARQVELYERLLMDGAARGVFHLASDVHTIARNLVALEDAYGLYIIGGAPMAEEARRLILSFASLATGCELEGGGADEP
jgi:DNA-binding transcriptional regulator YbjK